MFFFNWYFCLGYVLVWFCPWIWSISIFSIYDLVCFCVMLVSDWEGNKMTNRVSVGRTKSESDVHLCFWKASQFPGQIIKNHYELGICHKNVTKSDHQFGDISFQLNSRLWLCFFGGNSHHNHNYCYDFYHCDDYQYYHGWLVEGQEAAIIWSPLPWDPPTPAPTRSSWWCRWRCFAFLKFPMMCTCLRVYIFTWISFQKSFCLFHSWHLR